MLNGENSTLIPIKTDDQEEYKGTGDACFISVSSIDSSDLSSESQSERGGDSDNEEEKKQLFADLGPQTNKKWTVLSGVPTALDGAHAGT